MDADEALAPSHEAENRSLLFGAKGKFAAGEREEQDVVIDSEAAPIDAGSSVTVTWMSPVTARVLITCFAVAIESCRKPAVAVSMRTRTGAVPEVGAAGDPP